MQKYTDELTPDLLKLLKAEAKECMLTVSNTVSYSLIASMKEGVDLKQMIINNMINNLSDMMLKKSSFEYIEQVNRYDKVFKAQVFGFTSKELDTFITRIYNMGYNAGQVL